MKSRPELGYGVSLIKVHFNEGFHKWGYPQVDGLQGKIPTINGLV